MKYLIEATNNGDSAYRRRCVMMSKLLRCSLISDRVVVFCALPLSLISAPYIF